MIKHGNNPVICIAGMHRSGTSLLANWLHDSGLFLGNELLSGFSDNQKGHYEDLEILRLHVDLFSRHNEHPSGLYFKRKPVFDDIAQSKAKMILQNRIDQVQAWGWKEPRTTLYLSEWKEIIPKMKVIAVYRDINQVLLSLYRRLSKEKWREKTRNPFRKLYWWFDIDCQSKKWLNHFLLISNIYNKCIINYSKSFPEDCLIIKQEEFINGDTQKLGCLINDRFDIHLDYIPLSRIYDQHLMKSGEAIINTLNQDLVNEYYILKDQLEEMKTLLVTDPR